jgi:trehalose-6-phosphate synthase
MIPHSDGTPNSALETMICKKPLIMSKLNYQSPLFDNTCLFANPNDIQEISEKIETSINNYPTHLLQKASDSVLKYGNQKIEMEKILKIYGI